jgi:hypothetical protein
VSEDADLEIEVVDVLEESSNAVFVLALVKQQIANMTCRNE